jgi:hypothetical protein
MLLILVGFQVLNDDISLNVSQNLKEKIISGEYIDLAQLLQNPSVNGDKHNLVFEQGQLMLEPKVKPTKINSIENMDRCLHCLYVCLLFNSYH